MVIKVGVEIAAVAARLRDRRAYRRSALLYGAAVVLNPRQTDLHVQLADMLKASGWPSLADLAHKGAAITIVIRANRLRNRRFFSEAAELYRAALDLAPGRHKVAMQYGNMLKDSGKISAARAVYTAIISADPSNPEPWIGLGHLGNITGDKEAARQAFNTALELAPHRDDARHELVMAGDVRHQEEAFRRRYASGNWARVADLAARIDALEAEARKLRSQARLAHVEAAVPVRLYDHYLAANSVGSPPSISDREVLILMSGEEIGIQRIHRVCNGYLDQQHRNWRALIIGGGTEVAKAVSRIALSEPRLEFCEDKQELASRLARAHDETLVLLPAPGAVADPHALAWLVFAIDRTHAWGSMSDAVGEDAQTGGPTPILRDAPDPFASSSGPEHLGSVLFGVAPLRPIISGIRDFGELRNSVSEHLRSNPCLAHVPLPLFREPSGTASIDVEDTSTHPAPPGGRTIGVIVLTRDNGDDAQAFVASLRTHASRPDLLDIVVVDNGTRDGRSLHALDQLRRGGQARILSLDVPFNWSWLNNEAARSLSTDIIVFANDDMLMLTRGWDDTLRLLLERSEIGAVGAYLLYPDNTIQHAGILMGWNGSVTHHDGLGDHADAPGFLGRHRRTRAASAVTGAFMAVRREIFEASGGFDDKRLPIAYSDIDFCLSLRARQLAVLVTPRIRLRHYESKSRGLDHTNPERRARNAEEYAVMAGRWGQEIRVDRGLNPHWLMATLPFRLLLWPSEERILAHIERTGRGESWVLPG